MTDDASTTNLRDDPPAPPESPAPPAPAKPAESEDAIYDRAFANILADDAPSPAPQDPTRPEQDQAPPEPTEPRDHQAETPPDADDPATPDAGETPDPDQDPDLTDEQRQLLSRLHVTPEMIEAWTPEQRRAFIDNAAKRERDQTTAFKDLRERVKALEGTRPDAAEGGKDGQPEAEAASELAEQAKKVVTELADIYGDEIKPLGDVLGSLAGVADQLQDQLRRSESSGQLKDQLLVEMTIEAGIRDLTGDFPSLERAEARERVIQRFQAEWRNPDSPHRSGSGPVLDRIRSAMRDAASAEFKNTESAAQVALANKTKQRLKSQPQAGSSKGRAQPLSEEDVYDQAFDKHLKPELSR